MFFSRPNPNNGNNFFFFLDSKQQVYSSNKKSINVHPGCHNRGHYSKNESTGVSALLISTSFFTIRVLSESIERERNKPIHFQLQILYLDDKMEMKVSD